MKNTNTNTNTGRTETGKGKVRGTPNTKGTGGTGTVGHGINTNAQTGTGGTITVPREYVVNSLCSKMSGGITSCYDFAAANNAEFVRVSKGVFARAMYNEGCLRLENALPGSGTYTIAEIMGVPMDFMPKKLNELWQQYVTLRMTKTGVMYFPQITAVFANFIADVFCGNAGDFTRCFKTPGCEVDTPVTDVTGGVLAYTLYREGENCINRTKLNGNTIASTEAKVVMAGILPTNYSASWQHAVDGIADSNGQIGTGKLLGIYWNFLCGKVNEEKSHFTTTMASTDVLHCA